MNFLEKIWSGLRGDPERVVLQEPLDGGLRRATAADLLARAGRVRAWLRGQGLRRGDRCVLLAPNGIDMVAADLAILAEGLVKVPLYTRQSPDELAAMMRDCGAATALCGTAALRDALRAAWPQAPELHLLQEALDAGAAAVDEPPVALPGEHVACILYTSGTSGDAKGVMLTIANLDHMLPCTMSRLDELMRDHSGQERVFHYLPLCFAGSWLLLLTSLTRRSLLTLCTDLDRLATQLAVARPHYFLNVPILLDRIRNGVEERLRRSGGPVHGLYRRAQRAWSRRQAALEGDAAAGGGVLDGLWLALARAVIFRRIRRKISPNLVSLICGSAPLAVDTQLFFEMLGIPVLQVYGLTETTAICTMDRPRGPRRAGYVGVAIPGVEMRLGDGEEILVRGPNVFAGYWQRPEATAACMRAGWFHTGDRGEVDDTGNWRILGRVKNLIVLSSGHNVAPDPIEEALRHAVPGAEQVVVVGHQRKHLSAIVTGEVDATAVDAAVERINAGLPHYKRVRRVHVRRQPFTAEEGLVTANGKLKRAKILAAMEREIEAMYAGSAV